MPLPAIDVHYLGTVYSPFSGQAADTEDGANTGDPTLLFIYYGQGVCQVIGGSGSGASV